MFNCVNNSKGAVGIGFIMVLGAMIILLVGEFSDEPENVFTTYKKEYEADRVEYIIESGKVKSTRNVTIQEKFLDKSFLSPDMYSVKVIDETGRVDLFGVEKIQYRLLTVGEDYKISINGYNEVIEWQLIKE